MQTNIIVIPCYNESKRLDIPNYKSFLNKNQNVTICFVNDGSSDDTLDTITSMANQNPQQIKFFTYKKNVGKASAVRKGILYSLEKFSPKYISYIDADLSVSLKECISLNQYLDDKIHFCFGSRILRLGSDIQRKRYRFLIGRFIATIISMNLDLKVYDTQCGCKCFNTKLAREVFREEFISKWLFDVEIFFRILKIYGRNEGTKTMYEVPLKRWIDKGDSKVKMSYCFKLLIDLYNIKNKYKDI